MKKKKRKWNKGIPKILESILLGMKGFCVKIEDYYISHLKNIRENLIEIIIFEL